MKSERGIEERREKHTHRKKSSSEEEREREREGGKLLGEMGWNLRYAGGRHRQADRERQRDKEETGERERERFHIQS